MAESNVVEVSATANQMPAINLENYRIALENGKTLTPIEIANEAEALDRSVQGFTAHFWQLASVCQTAYEFDALCKAIELRKHWGRPTPDVPENERKLFRPQPTTWRVLKSTISRAWHDFGVAPGSTVSYIPKGEPTAEPETLEVTGINRLKTAVKIKRETAVAATKPRPDKPLRDVYERITAAYARLTEEDQQKLLKRLDKAAKDYEARTA